MYKFRGDSCLGAKVQFIWCSDMGPALFLKRESVRIPRLHMEGGSRLEQEVDVKEHTPHLLAGTLALMFPVALFFPPSSCFSPMRPLELVPGCFKSG